MVLVENINLVYMTFEIIEQGKSKTCVLDRNIPLRYKNALKRYMASLEVKLDTYNQGYKDYVINLMSYLEKEIY